jgi:TRAP-type C4-dicarboxylate transport system permease small subunit
MSVIDRLARGIARAALALSAGALLASLATIGYSVVRRYVFDTPVAWTDELVGYLLVASVMLAAADALFGGEHIAVDIVTERLSSAGKRVAYLFGLVTVMATAVLLVVEGIGTVTFSRQVGLRSNGSLAVEMWIPQLLVPIGAGLLLLAAIVAFAGAWRGEMPDHERAVPPQGLE